MSFVLKAAPALLLSALLFSPAAAAPVGPNTMGAISDSLVIQVRGEGHGHGGKGRGGKAHHGGNRHHGGNAHHGRNHGHHGQRGHNHYRHGGYHGGRGYWHGGRWYGGSRWVAGRTHYVAPPGWRQYGARPWNWQALGCVVVNGFWFCP